VDCVVPPSQPSLVATGPETRLAVWLPTGGSLVIELVLDGYPGPRLVVVFMVADENAEDDEVLLSFLFFAPVVVSRSQATFCRIWVCPQPVLERTRGSRSDRLSMPSKATSALEVWSEHLFTDKACSCLNPLSLSPPPLPAMDPPPLEDTGAPPAVPPPCPPPPPPHSTSVPSPLTTPF